MTLKYTLIIEGTEKELETARKVQLHEYFISFEQTCIYQPKIENTLFPCESFTYKGTITQVEYKVVEPLRVEYAATINSHGLINLITPDHRLIAHAGKKVSVVITELD
jgi:hypothetical protein